ncbi:MAG: hypothetical protein KGL39_18650 [Patescibacteria group bacterium]|nr:hypothetical protein [Patescibacteria group bacterium]
MRTRKTLEERCSTLYTKERANGYRPWPEVYVRAEYALLARRVRAQANGVNSATEWQQGYQQAMKEVLLIVKQLKQ